jgi:nucleotide-binding universal stress UspA family protein
MNARFAHIAVCVDHSDASTAAVEEAWKLREDGTERFTFVHVVPSPMVVAGHGAMWLPDPGQVKAGAQEWLDELVSRYPGSVGALLSGYPPVEACEWAGENGVDLLVAASSRGLFDRVLLGSFAGYLARHAPCSVLLTRPATTHASDQEASATAAKAG